MTVSLGMKSAPENVSEMQGCRPWRISKIGWKQSKWNKLLIKLKETQNSTIPTE